MTDSVITRFTFFPERAAEFCDDGYEVIEMALDSIEEVQEYSEQFKDALLDVSAIVNGQVISLSDTAGTNG